MPPREPARPPESSGKGADCADERLRAPTPFQKFNDLARKLLNVPREELHDAQERHAAANAARDQRKRRSASCEGGKSR